MEGAWAKGGGVLIGVMEPDLILVGASDSDLVVVDLIEAPAAAGASVNLLRGDTAGRPACVVACLLDNVAEPAISIANAGIRV